MDPSRLVDKLSMVNYLQENLSRKQAGMSVEFERQNNLVGKIMECALKWVHVPKYELIFIFGRFLSCPTLFKPKWNRREHNKTNVRKSQNGRAYQKKHICLKKNFKTKLLWSENRQKTIKEFIKQSGQWQVMVPLVFLNLPG